MGRLSEEHKRKNNEEREESEIHHQMIMNRWVLKCSINSKWDQKRSLPAKIKAWVGRRKAQEGWTHYHRDTKRPVEKALHVVTWFSFYVDFILCYVGNMSRTFWPKRYGMHSCTETRQLVPTKKERKKGTKRTKPKPKNGRLNCQVSVLWPGILELHVSTLAVRWESEVLIGCSASFF